MAINFLFDVSVNSGIDLQNTSITSLATPVNNTDAATKAYVDALVTASDLDFSGTTGTGAVDLDSQVFAVTGGTFVSTTASGQSLSIDLNATGSPSVTTFLRGDNTWSTPPDNNTTYTFAAVSGTPNIIRLTGTNPSSTNDIGLVATGNVAITFNSATSLGFDLASSISVANTITAGTGLTVTTGGVDVTGVGTFNTGISVTGDSSINGELDMSSNKIINVTDPTDAQDAATKNYVDITSTSGAVNFQGGYDAATNTPDLDSNPSSAIKRGWMYTVTADGTFFTEQVRTGDSLIAQIDAPTTLANWTTVQNNIDLADASTVGIGNVAGTTNDINVIYSAGTATVSQAPITISQTTSNISPGFGSAFTAIDSVGANSTGHVTSLNLKTINLPTPTFTSVGITETGNALTITNSPITTSGNINIAGAGTASQVILGNLTLGTYTTGTVESVGTSNSTFISGSGGPITGSGSLTYSLSATGTPSASTYLRGDNTWSPLPADNNNYVTSASFDTSTGVLTLSRQGLTAVTESLDGRYLTGNQSITLTGDVTGTGTTSIATTISSNVVGADELNVSSNGTSGQVLTSDGLGAFTWSTPFTGDITGVTAGNGLTGGGTAGTVTLTVGAGTGIQVNSTNVALATAGAGAGTYGSTSNSTKIDTITLDAYGRVTSVATGFTGSGDVTGSGTASVTGGQIPYWDATTNITGTTELNYSTVSGGSIGVVGIGNSSTAFGNSRLVVGSGSGGALMTLYGGGSNTNTIAFANGTSGNAQYRGQVRYNLQNDNLEFLTNGETFSRVYVDSAFDFNLVERSLNFRNSWPYDVGAYIDIPSNNQLSIGTNGGERLRVDSSGRVGIGTSSPDSILEVVDENPILIIRDTSTGLSSANSALRLAESGSGDTLDNYWDLKMKPESVGGTTNFAIANSVLGEVLNINYQGNVGIGTSPSGAKFHIVSTNSTAKFESSTTGLFNTYKNSNGDFAYVGTGSQTVSGGSANDFGVQALNNFVIATGGNTERMRIDSSGDIIMNLDSITDTRSFIFPMYNASNAKTEIRTTGTGDFRQHFDILMNTAQSDSAPTSVLRIQNNGNVGIGTTSPSRDLHISKDSADVELLLTSTTSGNVRLGLDASGATYNWIQADRSSSAMQFAVGNLERMRIDSSGRVGLGTSSPNAILHLVGQGGSGWSMGARNALHLQNLNASTTNVSNAIVLGDQTDADRWFIMNDPNANGATANELTITNAGSERMRIDSSGRVGIGTSSPNELLHVSRTSSGSGLLLENSAGGTGSFVTLDFNTYNVDQAGFANYAASIRVVDDGAYSGDITFRTKAAAINGGQTEKMRIDGATGNVGIGTNTPGAKLDVVGTIRTNHNNGHILNGATNTVRTGCTYSPENVFISGSNNNVGGFNSGVIGSGNSIPCPEAPWLQLGGNFIAGMNNTINNGYSHANAIFGQNHTLADSSVNVANAGSLISGDSNTLFGTNSFSWGYQTFAQVDASLTGGYQSVSFGSGGSVSIGLGCTASTGATQYAFGTGITTPTTATAAYGTDQFVVGRFNEYTNASSLPHRFAVGNGTSDSVRDTPFCVIGSGTYTNGQVSINDADGFAYTSAPYSILHVNGRATSSFSSTFTLTSDERLKKDILDYNKGLAEILQVQPKSYSFNGKANTIKGVKSIGVLAQDIKEVFPETVGTVNKRLNPEDEQETELYTVDISPVTYALINAVKELSAKIDTLENKIQTLEAN